MWKRFWCCLRGSHICFILSFLHYQSNQTKCGATPSVQCTKDFLSPYCSKYWRHNVWSVFFTLCGNPLRNVQVISSLYYVFPLHMEVFGLKIDCTKNRCCDNALTLLKTILLFYEVFSFCPCFHSSFDSFIFCC